ncbi:MAG: DUF1465 family protein [Alphaproteobacteria bacterium]|nr:DUF1465 family protein [Alphaproteobacteria bacterium]
MDASQDGKAAVEAPVVDHMFAEALEPLEGALAIAQLTAARTPSSTSTKGQVVAMRLTTRLANSVAWLMAVKAVNAGEISAADMARDYALTGQAHAVCLDDTGVEDSELHPALRALTAASLALYHRLVRLGELLARVARP